MGKITDVWEFVEKYYENYSSSEDIARWSDLGKIIAYEYEEDDIATRILKEEYNNSPDNPEIERDHNILEIQILKDAIRGWIKQHG